MTGAERVGHTGRLGERISRRAGEFVVGRPVEIELGERGDRSKPTECHSLRTFRVSVLSRRLLRSSARSPLWSPRARTWPGFTCELLVLCCVFPVEACRNLIRDDWHYAVGRLGMRTKSTVCCRWAALGANRTYICSSLRRTSHHLTHSPNHPIPNFLMNANIQRLFASILGAIKAAMVFVVRHVS